MANVLVTRSVRLVALALATLGCVSAASADPIVITSGRLINDDEPQLLRLRGVDGFELVAGFSPDFLGFRNPLGACLQMRCTAGTAVDMSAVAGGPSAFRPFSLGLGTVTINGNRFFSEREPGRLVGTLRFDAPTVILPHADVRGEVLVAVPFVFSGDVTGFARTDTTGTTPLFHVDLLGQGSAVLFGLDFGDGNFQFEEADYTFAATPEPASLLLLGTGLAGIWRHGRRRRFKQF